MSQMLWRTMSTRENHMLFWIWKIYVNLQWTANLMCPVLCSRVAKRYDICNQMQRWNRVCKLLVLSSLSCFLVFLFPWHHMWAVTLVTFGQTAWMRCCSMAPRLQDQHHVLDMCETNPTWHFYPKTQFCLTWVPATVKYGLQASLLPVDGNSVSKLLDHEGVIEDVRHLLPRRLHPRPHLRPPLLHPLCCAAGSPCFRCVCILR